jgi:molybdopterin-guanine dinucleotide biosynthesis protein A
MRRGLRTLACLSLPIALTVLQGRFRACSQVLIGPQRKGPATSSRPQLPCDLVPQLQLAAEIAGVDLALAATPDGRQPTFGLWPVRLRDDLREALNGGLRKVVMWTQKHNAATANFPDSAAFFNVNTPEDLETARGIL